MKELLNKIKAGKIEIEVVEGELKILGKNRLQNKKLIEEIKQQEKKLIAFLKNNTLSINTGKPGAIPLSAETGFYPLSPAQQWVWQLSQTEAGNVANNLPSFRNIEGNINPLYMAYSFKNLIERHEILRTVFIYDAKTGVKQQVKSAAELKFNVDYRDLRKDENKEELVNTLIREDLKKPFDLSNGPLLRVSLLQVHTGKYVFLFNIHQLICDAISMTLVIKELFAFYNSYAQVVPDNLPELPIQYKDYAVWHQQRLGDEAMTSAKDYWLSQFAGKIPVLNIKGDSKRTENRTYSGDTVTSVIDHELSQGLKTLCRKQNATLFMGLLASLNSLLYRYSNDDEIIIGTPIAGREHVELENQLGVFINLLALRLAVSGKASFNDLLDSVRDKTLAAYEHRAFPFSELVKALDLTENKSRNTLFDVLLILLDNSQQDEKEHTIGDIKITEHKNKPGIGTLYDLTFLFKERDDELHLSIEFNTGIFHKSTIERLAGHFRRLLYALVMNPKQDIDQLDYLDSTEKRELLSTFNSNVAMPAVEKTFPELFSERLLISGEESALLCNNRSVTYHELNHLADSLATRIKNRVAKERAHVAVICEPGIENTLALLAVLKSGAVYVPIDAGLNSDAINTIVKWLETGLIITTNQQLDKLESITGYQIIKLDEEFTDSFVTENSQSDYPQLNAIACIKVTLNESAKPIGVMLDHQSISNTLLRLDDVLDLKETDHLLTLKKQSESDFISEILYPLYKGSLLTLTPGPEEITGADRFVKNAGIQLNFSMQCVSQLPDIAMQANYRLLLNVATFAEANNFDSIWLPENHFTQNSGMSPNPAVLASALAAITKKIGIRGDGVKLPLHDILTLAEDWMLVDNLSGGRVAMAVSSGDNPDEFVLRPTNYGDRYKYMQTQLEELKWLWDGNSRERINGLNAKVKIKAYPGALQKKLPVWISTSCKEDDFVYAGKTGAGIITSLSNIQLNELEENIRRYKNTLAENGFNPVEAKIAAKVYAGFDSENTVLVEHHAQTHCIATKENADKLIAGLHLAGVTEIVWLVDFASGENTVLDKLQAINKLRKLYGHSPDKVSVRSNTVTALCATPSQIKTLCSDPASKLFLKSLRQVIINRGNINEVWLENLQAKTDASLYHIYGNTESGLCTSAKKINRGSFISHGKPVNKAAFFILDKENKLCPVGVTGNVYVGGPGLASGYYKNEKLNESNFIPNPIKSSPVKRLFKTGDKARWLQNGELEFEELSGQ